MHSVLIHRLAPQFCKEFALLGAALMLVTAGVTPKAQAASIVPSKLAVPAAPSCHFPVTGLIQSEWMRIGGPASPIGCPTAAFHADGAGGAGVQPFQHGEIAVSPQVWERGVVAAWQDGNGIEVDWTVSWTAPAHFNYDKFLVRWDFNGRHTGSGDTCAKRADLPGDGDQCDVMADMTKVQKVLLHYYQDTHLRTSGTWALPVDHGNGLYKIVVEGCDVPTVGHSKCRQGWMRR